MAEPRLAQSRFPENLDQFRAFMDNSPVFAWAKDERGRYVYLNRTSQVLLGDAAKNCLGMSDFEIWSTETASQFRKSDLTALQQERVVRTIETLSAADGGKSYIICRFPFADAAGNRLVGGVGVDVTEQKRLEAALRASEQRLQTLSDLAVEGILIHDSRTIVDANARAPRLLGYERDELLGRSPADLIAPELLEQARQHARMRDLTPYETLAIRKDGSRMPVETISRQIGSEAESPWVTVFRDLTPRKATEQALRDSEERLRLAQDAANFGYFDWNLRTGNTIWSESLERLFGVLPDSSTSILDKIRRVHPEDRQAFQTQVENALQGGSSVVSVAYRSTGPDGGLRWRMCEARVHSDESGKPARTVGVITDLTAHKQAEEVQRIERERRRLESVISSLTDAVVILDAEGRTLSMNPAALKTPEIRDSPFPAKTPADLPSLIEVTDQAGRPLPMGDWPASRALRGESVSGLEVDIRNLKTGHCWSASCSAAPILDAHGKVSMVVVTIRDITADRTASQEIRKANAALHELSGQLMRAQDLERKRIAREIHDGTLQLVTAMSMNLLAIARAPNVIGDSETRQLITETQDLVKQASLELRALSYLLHPPDLDELGLASALRSWADRFAIRIGIALDLRVEDSSPG